MASSSSVPDNVLIIDPDAMTRVCYSAITTLIEQGNPSETVEVVPGEPQTLVRLWQLPMSPLRMGVLEPIYQALIAHPKDDKAFAEAVREIIATWEPTWERLMDNLEETISVGFDGIALELGDGLH